MLSRVAAIVIIMGAVLALIGWEFDIEYLKRVRRGYVAMNPLTAILFILAGISLWQLMHPKPAELKLVRLLAAIIIGIGLFKFVSVFIGVDIYLDRLFFADKLFEADRNIPNRMAPNTAFCFVLTGLAMLLIEVETPKGQSVAQFFCVPVILVALLSLYGYIYGVTYLIGIAAYIPMAPNTAGLFLFLAAGLLFSRPDKGSMRIVCSSEDTNESLFSRVVVVFIPLLFGWLELRGEKKGYFSEEFGTAILALLTYAFSMVLLGRNALMKYRIRKEKLKTELVLRENSKKLQSILDNTATPIYIKNQAGQYELVNRQFEYDFGVTATAVKGKTEDEVFQPEVAAELAANERQVMETGRPRLAEEVFWRDNEKRTYLTVLFPLKDTEGQPYGLCSIATDITERKQMETQLRESEQRLQAIISSIGEGVVVSDTNMNFIVFNPIAEEILGFGIADIPVNEWSSRYGTYRPDKVTPFPSEELPLFRALHGESANEVEMFIRNPVFPAGKSISVTGRPIRNNQQDIIGSVVVFRDISAMKHLEALILENDKRLQAIIASIGEGIVVSDKQGKFVLFNKKAEELLGMGAAEIPLTEWSEWYGVYRPDKRTPFPPEELPLARALKGESTHGVELFIRNANFPEGRTISVSGHPITDEQGQVTASVVDFQDITEMKKLEETLAEIKAKYQLVISRHRGARKNLGPEEA